MKTSTQIIKQLGALITLCSLSFLVSACTSHRTIPNSVQLTPNSYKVVQAGATGSSYGFRFLGIFPFASANYATAKKDLYASVDTPLKGKSIALVNQTESRSSVYLILFSIPHVTITADVIEFVDKEEPKPAAATP